MVNVNEGVPAAIDPDSVPPSGPVPVARESVTAVVASTFVAMLDEFCAVTVTLNGVPAVGEAGLIEVTTSFDAADEPTTRETVPALYVAFVGVEPHVVLFHIVTVGVSVTVPTGVAPVVVIVSVALVEPEEFAVTQVELKPAPVGRPATEVTSTARDVPPLVTVTEYVALLPGVTGLGVCAP